VRGPSPASRPKHQNRAALWSLLSDIGSDLVGSEGVFGAGDKVAVRLRFRGTHCGDFLGIPATGRAVECVSHEF